MGERARVFEVGPRDGLQNESRVVGVGERVELIERLVGAGSRDVEIGSFVHPEWIPQMAGTDEVAARIERAPGVRYWALVPNEKGLERAQRAVIEHAAFFISASETHNRKNMNRGVAETLETIGRMAETCASSGIETRGYISMSFGCPYEGEIAFERVLEVAGELRARGVDMISIGDTVGFGAPPEIRAGCAAALELLGADQVALHLHDTRGLGLANALVAWEQGMRHFDSSVGGIGGCPYAPGAAGNLGTEDLLHLLESIGAAAPMRADEVSAVAAWLERTAGISVPSRYTRYLKTRAA